MKIILKDSFIYLFGELVAKALPFLLLPYLTRKLGVVGFGEMSYYQTILSLLALFFGFSQDGALTRYFYFYGKRNLHNLMLAGYAHVLFLTCLGLIFSWLKQSLLLASVVCAAAGQTLLNTQLAWRQCQKHAIAYAAIQIASGIISSILTVGILESTSQQPVMMRFWALILSHTIIAAIAYFFVQKEGKSIITWRRIRLSGCYILSFGTPLLLHHAGNFVKGQFDRLIIYQYFSAEKLGIYAAALQVASILSILLMAVNKAIVPYYYQLIKQNRVNATQIRHYALITTLVSPVFALIAYMLPENVFIWFLGVNYAGVHYYICLFLLGYGLMMPYFLLVNYLFFYGKNKLISFISVISTVVYILAVLSLSSLGLFWVPYAMIIGNVSILPILYYFVRDFKSSI